MPMQVTSVTGGESFNPLAPIFAMASRYPERAALRTPSVSLTYRGLRVMVLAIAAHLRERGLRNGGILAIDVEHPIPALAAALAAGSLGAAWVHATRDALQTTAITVQFALTDRAVGRRRDENILHLDAGWFSLPDHLRSTPSLSFEGFISGAQAFAIAQSSGTTGTSKLMAISAENAFSRSDPGNLLDRSEVPVAGSYFHPLHQGNMWNILRVLRSGGCFLLGGSLEHWLACEATYVIGSPAHFLRERSLILAQDHPRIANAWIGGGPIYAAQVKDLLRMFHTVHVTYGASEAGIMSAKSITRSNWQDGPVKLGRIDRRCTVEIAGGDGMPLPAGHDGLVRMKTPWMVKGYLGDPDSTARFFRDGWFFTGDTGRIDADGELIISGRAVESVNLGGTKINPALIDEIIMRHPLITDAICFVERTADGRETLAAVLHAEGQEVSASCLDEITARIAAEFGRSRVPRAFYSAMDMPRNANGKAMRSLAASQVSQFRKLR